jgi:hypothetical protein
MPQKDALLRGRSEDRLQNPLQDLLELPDCEKDARGIRHTTREIAQPPGTWENTYRKYHHDETGL